MALAVEAVGGFLAAAPSDAQLAEVAGVIGRAFPGASFAQARAPRAGKTAASSTAPAALLSAPHPNPAAGATDVRFSLAEAADVRLTVYDALGREVAVLADGAHAEGPHTVAFDGRALAPGVYLVRLAADGAAATTRLTVVR